MCEKPRIIGTMFCCTDVQTMQKMAEVKGGNAIEIRYDTENGTYSPDAAYYKTELEVISTCMTTDEGGYFKGPLGEWAALLKHAVDCGTDYIIISLEQAETEQGKELMEYAKSHKVKIIIGVHNQSMLAAETIIKTLGKIKLAGADIAKVVCMADDPKDVSEIILASCLCDLGIPKIMIAIGKHGKFWRAMSLIPPLNCWGMFASIGKPTAEGQLSVDEIVKTLDILE